MRRFCGTDIPQFIVKYSRDITVYFHSDVNFQAQGFQATYEALSEGNNTWQYIEITHSPSLLPPA